MTFRLFAPRIGDKPLSTITRVDVSAFLEILSKLPRHHGKDGRAKPIKVAINEAAASVLRYSHPRPLSDTSAC